MKTGSNIAATSADRTTWNAGPRLSPMPLLTCDICGRRSRRDVCEGSDGIMRCDKCRNRAFYTPSGISKRHQGQFTRNKLVI